MASHPHPQTPEGQVGGVAAPRSAFDERKEDSGGSASDSAASQTVDLAVHGLILHANRLHAQHTLELDEDLDITDITDILEDEEDEGEEGLMVSESEVPHHPGPTPPLSPHRRHAIAPHHRRHTHPSLPRGRRVVCTAVAWCARPQSPSSCAAATIHTISIATHMLAASRPPTSAPQHLSTLAPHLSHTLSLSFALLLSPSLSRHDLWPGP